MEFAPRGSHNPGVRGERDTGRIPIAERPIAGVSTMGWATILAVVAVVFVVTFSNLRGMALRENESHAEALLRAFGELLTPEVLADAPRDLQAWSAAQQGFDHELTDAHWVGDDGALLLRHGYLFEWRPSATGPLLVAWPTEHGLSGRRAFLWSPDGGVVTLPNEARAWSGMERRPGPDLTPEPAGR